VKEVEAMFTAEGRVTFSCVSKCWWQGVYENERGKKPTLL
jgi:hypothetical protein